MNSAETRLSPASSPGHVCRLLAASATRTSAQTASPNPDADGGARRGSVQEGEQKQAQAHRTVRAANAAAAALKCDLSLLRPGVGGSEPASLCLVGPGVGGSEPASLCLVRSGVGGSEAASLCLVRPDVGGSEPASLCLVGPGVGGSEPASLCLVRSDVGGSEPASLCLVRPGVGGSEPAPLREAGGWAGPVRATECSKS
eukprot:365942-Chlamydomonas_euryale.AAC.77